MTTSVLSGCYINDKRLGALLATYKAPSTGPSSTSGAKIGYAQIESSILKPKCLQCHMAGASVDLSSYSATMTYVVAGNPDTSRFYLALKSGSMPQGLPALSASDLQLVHDWIAEGALNAVPNAPVPGTTSSPVPTPSPSSSSSPSAPPASLTATYSSLASNIFIPKCVSCHSGSSPSAGFDISTYSGVYSRVIAGDPNSSRLYLRVADGTMAPGSPLSAPEKQAISDWITAGAKNDGGTVTPAPTVTAIPLGPTFKSVQANVFGKYCLSCHNSSNAREGYSFSTYSSTLQQGIVAGSASSSKVYNVMVSGSMPQGGPHLGSAELQAVRDWINSGAPNN